MFVSDGIPLMRERVFSRLPLIGRLQRYSAYAPKQENGNGTTEGNAKEDLEESGTIQELIGNGQEQ